MSDPSLDLQKAIINALKADNAVKALVGNPARVYDKIPGGATFPYVSYGSDQVLSDDADCLTAYEVFVQLDVWSRANGQPEMKRIAGAIRAVLHDAELELDEHALVLLEHQQTRYLDDPDGITSHAAITLRALADGA